MSFDFKSINNVQDNNNYSKWHIIQIHAHLYILSLNEISLQNEAFKEIQQHIESVNYKFSSYSSYTNWSPSIPNYLKDKFGSKLFFKKTCSVSWEISINDFKQIHHRIKLFRQHIEKYNNEKYIICYNSFEITDCTPENKFDNINIDTSYITDIINGNIDTDIIFQDFNVNTITIDDIISQNEDVIPYFVHCNFKQIKGLNINDTKSLRIFNNNFINCNQNNGF